MNEVRRSHVAGWRARALGARRFTAILLGMLLAWLLLWWLLGRVATR